MELFIYLFMWGCLLAEDNSFNLTTTLNQDLVQKKKNPAKLNKTK